MALYPGSLDTLTVPSATATLGGSTPSHRTAHQEAAEAIMAVQATLGVNPQGSDASVAARLAAMASADRLTSGTLPDARLSANVPVMTSGVLPAASGANLTGLTKAQVGLTNVPDVDATNADNLAAGTVPDARLAATIARLGVAQTWTEKQTLRASDTAAASLTIPHGAAPTTPVNGDIWTTTSGVFARLNGATRTIATLESGATFTNAIRTSSTTAGIGYNTGAGGTVTQATSKTTGVSLSRSCGTITLNAASLAAGTSVSFTFTNTAIAATDLVVMVHDSAGTLGAYSINVTPAAGSATVTVRNNTAGALAEAIVLRFAVIKAVTA